MYKQLGVLLSLNDVFSSSHSAGLTNRGSAGVLTSPRAGQLRWSRYQAAPQETESPGWGSLTLLQAGASLCGRVPHRRQCEQPLTVKQPCTPTRAPGVPSSLQGRPKEGDWGHAAKTRPEGHKCGLSSPASPLQINTCFYKALLGFFHADHPAPPQLWSRLAQGCLRQDILQGTASAQHTYKQ